MSNGTNQTNQSNTASPPYVGHEFEIAKYRHEDQAKLLQEMTKIDLQLFSGFLTIQLALGSFLLQKNIESTSLIIGLLLIDLSLALLCFVLLRNNYKRRQEAVETIRNCNQALGLSIPNAIVQGLTIDSKTKFRPWFHWYTIGILLSTLGIMFILFKAPISINNKNEKESKTELNIIDSQFNNIEVSK